MSVLRGLLEHFVAPAGSNGLVAREDFVPPDEAPDRACAEPAPRTPPGLALLAPAADVQPIGAALGLALARRCRTRIGVVCVWTAGTGVRQCWRAPAAPAARRMAAVLAARGIDARPAGRLVLVRLSDSAANASMQARRVGAAAGVTPTVLALGGPRAEEFDELLSEQDLVVIATPGGSDPALGRLALAGLASGVARACACEIPPAHAARTVAAAGLALLPSVRRPLAAAFEALP